jgi:site-specific recombinase XerD
MNQIKLFKELRGEQAEQSNYSDIINYIGDLRVRNLHAKSLKNHLFSLKIYFRHLVTVGKRSDHPCENLNLKDQIQRSIIVESLYSKEQLEELYSTFESPVDQRKWATKSESIKKRDKVILSLLIFQALTTTEITSLKLESINLDECTICIKSNESKGRRGNKSRTLPLHSRQILLINNYINIHRIELWNKQAPEERQDYFILNNQGLQIWGSYLNRMLSKGREPHEIFTPLKIRQSVIANLLKEKNDTRVVQEFAGHRRTGSTEAYKRTGLEELKSSIERLHPRQ